MDQQALTNHRLAPRMAALAFVAQNVTMAALYAPFGVLLLAVEARYGVSRQGSSLALALMSASLALCAPLVGILAERFTARTLMMSGGMCCALGYALLALSNRHIVYLLVYALLFGPAICLSGAIVPSALVTRWFVVHRGRALGIVHMPLLMGPLALAAAFLLRSFGLVATYGLFAALCLLVPLAAAFVLEAPPTAATAATAAVDRSPVSPALPVATLLADRHFWLLTIAFAACIAGNMVWGAHVIAMVRGWGIADTQAAGLVMATSLAGIVGNPALGWILDRLGARNTMILLCLDCAGLWALLLLHPAYPALVAIALGFGFHGGATMAIFAAAISEFFGQATFSRTFGLSKLLTLPFTLLAIPAAAAIFMRTGSYAPALAIQAGFFLFAGLAVAAFGKAPAHPNSRNETLS